MLFIWIFDRFSISFSSLCSLLPISPFSLFDCAIYQVAISINHQFSVLVYLTNTHRMGTRWVNSDAPLRAQLAKFGEPNLMIRVLLLVCTMQLFKIAQQKPFWFVNVPSNADLVFLSRHLPWEFIILVEQFYGVLDFLRQTTSTFRFRESQNAFFGSQLSSFSN